MIILISSEESSIKDMLPNYMMDVFQYNMSPKTKHNQIILQKLAINVSGWFPELEQ